MDLKKPTCREVPLRVGFEIHVSSVMRRTSSMTEAAKRNALAEALGSCAKRGARSMLSALSLFYFRTLVEAEHILTRARLHGARPDWSRAANRPMLVSSGKGLRRLHSYKLMISVA
jgi:hypothetical protein